MTWRRIFGLDPIEFIIYWFVAIMAGVFLTEASGMDEVIPLTMGVSALGYALLRRRALSRGGSDLSEDTSSVVARLQDEQAASADFFERRINELEERLDFTERLLTEQRDRQLAQGQPTSHERG
jgi:hypothetical protein